MEFLNVAHMKRQRDGVRSASSGEAPSSTATASSRRRRRLGQQSDAPSDIGTANSGTRATTGLTIIVVRPRLPDGCVAPNTAICDQGCPPLNRLVGACDAEVRDLNHSMRQYSAVRDNRVTLCNSLFCMPYM